MEKAHGDIWTVPFVLDQQSWLWWTNKVCHYQLFKHAKSIYPLEEKLCCSSLWRLTFGLCLGRPPLSHHQQLLAMFDRECNCLHDMLTRYMRSVTRPFPWFCMLAWVLGYVVW